MMNNVRRSIAGLHGRPGTRIACALALAAAVGLLPVAAMADVDVEVDEGEKAVIEVFRYHHTGGSSSHGNTYTYDYATEDGSASKNLDYKPVSGKLTFGPGVNSKKIEIETREDTCEESDETFDLKLTNGKCTFSVAGITFSCPTSHMPGVTQTTFEVKIKEVAHDGSDSYLNTAQGCSGSSSGSTFGE